MLFKRNGKLITASTKQEAIHKIVAKNDDTIRFMVRIEKDDEPFKKYVIITSNRNDFRNKWLEGISVADDFGNYEHSDLDSSFVNHKCRKLTSEERKDKEVDDVIDIFKSFYGKDYKYKEVDKV